MWGLMIWISKSCTLGLSLGGPTVANSIVAHGQNPRSNWTVVDVRSSVHVSNWFVQPKHNRGALQRTEAMTISVCVGFDAPRIG